MVFRHARQRGNVEKIDKRSFATRLHPDLANMTDILADGGGEIGNGFKHDHIECKLAKTELAWEMAFSISMDGSWGKCPRLGMGCSIRGR
jgi:hypothetical protein